MSEDKRLERIEKKVDDTNEHLSSIDITLAAQHQSLRDHIRRTALLEQELKPIKKHVNMVDGVVKFLAVVATVLAVLKALGAI